MFHFALPSKIFTSRCARLLSLLVVFHFCRFSLCLMCSASRCIRQFSLLDALDCFRFSLHFSQLVVLDISRFSLRLTCSVSHCTRQFSLLAVLDIAGLSLRSTLSLLAALDIFRFSPRSTLFSLFALLFSFLSTSFARMLSHYPIRSHVISLLASAGGAIPTAGRLGGAGGILNAGRW